VVSFILRTIIVATPVHCDVGPSLSCGLAGTGTMSNTQGVTSAYLFHSVATHIPCSKECTLYFSQLLELSIEIMFSLCLERVMYVLMKSTRKKEKECDVPVKESRDAG
jgi:hypothetical protein